MRKPGHEESISHLQTSQPTLETFQDLLHRHPDAFYLARTAKALQAHWQLMKQYYLLEDQTGNKCPRSCVGSSQVFGWENMGSVLREQLPAVSCDRLLSSPSGSGHIRLPKQQQQNLPPCGAGRVCWQGLWHHGRETSLPGILS